MPDSRPVKYALAGVAAVALALGAYAVGSSNSGNGSSGTANAAPPGGAGQAAPQGNQLPQDGQGGQLPQTGQAPPGFGTRVTGAAARRAAAAALAKYKGDVEQVMKLDDGSYVVHVITSNGEYHVAVSGDFKVTGADQRGPRGPGGVAPGGTTPSGSGSPA